MSKKELFPPVPPKSWAGLPRSLTKNRNNDKSINAGSAIAGKVAGNVKGANATGAAAKADAGQVTTVLQGLLMGHLITHLLISSRIS